MDELLEQELKKHFPSLISTPKQINVDRINERLLEYCFENNLSDENIVETVEQNGFAVNEEILKSEEFNEATRKMVEKMKKKYEGMDGVYISVMSEGNRVTQNGTMYSYETLNNAISDKEFKRRLKERSIIFQGDHPEDGFFSSQPESVFKNSAVLLDVFWEDVGVDPTKMVGADPKLNNRKAKKGSQRKVETNGMTPVRLFGVFQLMGQHKEHFEDIIEKSRQGISSRGYGVGDRVEDQAENFLYYEILALQLETWDFVVRQSVKRASFTKDGDLNENKKIAEELGISEAKDDNVNVNENSEVETDSEDSNLMEDKEMNPEEILKYLRSVEGKAVRDVIVTEAVEKAKVDSEKSEKIATLESKIQEQEAEISEKEETISTANNELEAMKTANEELKATNEKLEAQVAEIAAKEFAAHKESFYNQYNDDVASKLKAKLDGIETLEAFQAQADILVEFMPESAKKDYKAPSVAEQITNGAVKEVESEDPGVSHTESKKEEGEAKNDPFKESKHIAMSLFSDEV